MNTQKYVIFLSIATTVSLLWKALPSDTCPSLLSSAIKKCEDEGTVSHRVPSIVLH